MASIENSTKWTTFFKGLLHSLPTCQVSSSSHMFVACQVLDPPSVLSEVSQGEESGMRMKEKRTQKGGRWTFSLYLFSAADILK
jgi:hypothetical protein